MSEVVTVPVMAPGVCFICEQRNDETRFVDTVRTFDPGGPTKLNGRKYLCEGCVRDAVKKLEIDAEIAEPFLGEIAEMAAKLAEVDAALEIAEAAAMLADKLAPFIPKPKTTRAPKATPATETE